MLLSVSSLILSQNTATRSISEAQISELYKGIKQNEYLKVRLQKTEGTLNSANELISEQEKALTAGKILLKAKDEIIATNQEILKQEKIGSLERENQLKSDIEILKGELSILEIQSKKTARKKLWTGIKIGGVSVAVLGAVGLLLIK